MVNCYVLMKKTIYGIKNGGAYFCFKPHPCLFSKVDKKASGIMSIIRALWSRCSQFPKYHLTFFFQGEIKIPTWDKGCKRMPNGMINDKLDIFYGAMDSVLNDFNCKDGAISMPGSLLSTFLRSGTVGDYICHRLQNGLEVFRQSSRWPILSDTNYTANVKANKTHQGNWGGVKPISQMSL